ncbi:MAG: 50S ribosomal protein L1 [Planctomycetaceae bacterium]|nr:50S ribosomal protein L1 [Planctomycetota bacterium]NUN51263.1 50S ribosomal protein L1 [Planctomycetaceae bacterium]
MRTGSKRYRAAAGKVDARRKYPVEEAVSLLKSMQAAKFDETVELALNLGVDPKKGDQIVRGSVVLPHGLGGKSRSVLVFAEGEKAKEAEIAGADFVGGQDLVKKVEGGWTEFDVAIAVPAMMRFVGRLGRVLGPAGKMPSPKAGTVTDDVARAVKEYKAGKVEYRVDAGASVHAPIGKRSFDEGKIRDNILAFVDSIRAQKPGTSKGVYIRSVTLSSTMSPGIALDIQ